MKNSTNPASTEITRRTIFETIGRVSVLFSTLEADINDLLCVLIHGEEPMLAATLIEGTTFARSLDLLEKTGRFKDAKIEFRISQLLEVARPLRKKRNLFIHGRWDISPTLLGKAKVAVSDSRIRFERKKNSKSWHRGAEHVIAYHELREYETEVMRALKVTRELEKFIEGEYE